MQLSYTGSISSKFVTLHAFFLSSFVYLQFNLGLSFHNNEIFSDFLKKSRFKRRNANMVSNPIISIGNSTIRGNHKTSIRGRKYYRFLGIPYAKPPINELRFLPPQPLELPNFIKATREKNWAVQQPLNSFEIIGNEDCLYLDVFIPELPSGKLLPVIFYIHGGAHAFGSKNSISSAKLQIENGVIIVAINYRLNVFGFLNLGIPECPGNAGCKDLVCGLRWVKKYIKYFGGDPDNITLMGISSGASMAHLMALSPLCKNMFEKVIACGGHATSPWNFTNSPIETAFELGEILGFEGQDKNELCRFLKLCSAETLMNAVGKLNAKDPMRLSRNCFVPSIDFIAKEAFLPEHPFNLLEKMNPISLIFGANELEGIMIWKRLNLPEHWTAKDLIKDFLEKNVSIEEQYFEKMLEEVLQFYTSCIKPTEIYVLEFFTDMMLNNYYLTTEILQKKLSFFYVYKFIYCGNCNRTRKTLGTIVEGKEIEGSYHGDELGYVLAPLKNLYSEKDWEISDAFGNYLKNFVISGNPNENNVNCIWTPSSSDNECYLEIGTGRKLIPNGLNSERAKFWIYLKEKYSFEFSKFLHHQ